MSDPTWVVTDDPSASMVMVMSPVMMIASPVLSNSNENSVPEASTVNWVSPTANLRDSVVATAVTRQNGGTTARFDGKVVRLCDLVQRITNVVYNDHTEAGSG